MPKRLAHLGRARDMTKPSLRRGTRTCRVVPCRLAGMAEQSHRLNLTLDAERAERLRRLAERTHLQEGTLARSLLSAAIDEADTDPRNVVALLDGISGAYERAELSRRQIRAGEGIALDQLERALRG